MRTDEQSMPDASVQIRICVMIFLAFVIFSILGIQLWNTQVRHRRDYEEKALRQSVRRIRIPPLRGRILAADGTPLAVNRASYNVQLHLAEMSMPRQDAMLRHILAEADRAADRIGRKNPLTEEKIRRHLNLYPGIPMPLFSDLAPAELARLWELAPAVTGLEIVPGSIRDYPSGPMAAHLIGYVGKGDPESADDRSEYFYYFPDPEGKEGLEKSCDGELRGSPGKKMVLVDSRGFVREELEEPARAKNGRDVILSLDSRAQRIAEELLAGRTGSIVVLEAETGAVTAMASSPSFRPGDFVPFISREKYAALRGDPDMPFLNRSTMGTYLPGSVIKPLCALACLENGVPPDETVDCTGRSPFGYGRGINCSSRFGHGPVDIRRAIQFSCNVYFVNNAVRIGIGPLSEMYASAGIGRKTGIDIPERAGLLPPVGRWNENETAYVGFGQGKISVTALQVAVYYAALANGGKLMRPYLIGRICETDGDRRVSVFDALPKETGRLAASPENIGIVKEGMYLVVQGEGGSGRRAKIDKTAIYGKTGTADVESEIEPKKHVWFAGFAQQPVTGKWYSIAVLIERGESGGKTAAPLAGEFFQRFFPDPPEPEAEPSDS